MAKHTQAPGIGIHTPDRMPKCDEQERRVPQNSSAPEITRVPVAQRILSIALLNGARELVIEHAGEEYRLRLTSKGKLILTK